LSVSCASVGRGAHEFARPLPRPSVQRVREICSSRSLMPWLVRQSATSECKSDD
jgi:hypothetical protein